MNSEWRNNAPCAEALGERHSGSFIVSEQESCGLYNIYCSIVDGVKH